jgi:hypothetical protein
MEVGDSAVDTTYLKKVNKGKLNLGLGTTTTTTKTTQIETAQNWGTFNGSWRFRCY